MATRYVDRLPEKRRHEALDLYLEVLGDKLVPVLGTMEKAKRLLARDLFPQRCVAAFRGERLAGVLCVQTPAGSFWNPSMESLIEEYGTLEALFRLLGLYFLYHETGPEEWHIDGIAVAEWARSEGVGAGLIDRMEQLAAENGVGKISLEVANTNQRAVAFYERSGFVEVSRRSLWLFNLFFKMPFRVSIAMEKTVAGSI